MVAHRIVRIEPLSARLVRFYCVLCKGDVQDFVNRAAFGMMDPGWYPVERDGIKYQIHDDGREVLSSEFSRYLRASS
jgi:hypothetical protein